jgi:Ca-activated chloride channel family protein
MLSKQLSAKDSVAIVVYAGASGVVLEPTQGNDTHKIEAALNQLTAGGSTNGQAGIQLAYQLAKQNFKEEGINRVVLATDGDFNVGMNDVDSLKDLIKLKRKEGIFLTTLGFGTGNYNDELMEALANNGNGNYAYIDTFAEAKKVLAEEMSATLMTIAKDVKIQVEFNPSVVKEYRLLGYENRTLNREDFNNDRVDAGEIGAGHTVTAIYEIALQSSPYSSVDPLRYEAEKPSVKDMSGELAFVKFRYKAPDGDKSKLISQPISLPTSGDMPNFEDASDSFKFAASVAQFGEALRQSKYLDANYEQIISNALATRGEDAMGYRSEFIQLVRLAKSLSGS